ncbi:MULTISPECIES: succinate dehydrogenase, hydrophobic membrane anchor protein [Rhodobacterales]|uniref:succinate dehydrogenase, hydrophobic membrane anchor protein n=1 Tax=Roseobacter sp. N2S TaxID=2663844 RepID=UPI0028560BF8|nr:MULTISPECIES: succinate dehydrogenase, hydrophobic membrane anchor protein [Rhodobacterales]MDR6264944.1 succinate dehydrogenase / fumarate reductase membrane anchor subunit [Roseobacter sp. N2S]
MSYKTDLGRVIGLGTANEGVHEWFSGRVLSVALIPLSILFLCFVAPLIGEDHATVVAAFQNPFKAVVVILFFLVAFKHLADGLKEIVLDYVHGKALLAITLVSTRLICYFFGAAGAFAVAKIAFAG